MNEYGLVGAGLAVLGSKDILLKLLGPTAEYIGDEAKGLVQKCNINLDNIFRKAINKLGSKIEKPGQVNSRVLKHVIDEGRFCEDELSAEYFGGMLAASRSKNGNDDRALPLLAVVKRMSSYQLKTHYLIYKTINKFFEGTKLNPLIDTEAKQMEIYISYHTLHHFMSFNIDELAGFAPISTHIINGLTKEGLIRNQCYYGDPEHLKNYLPKSPKYSWGFTCRPSGFGIELFNYAYGMKDENISKFTEKKYPDIEFDKSAPIRNVHKTTDLK